MAEILTIRRKTLYNQLINQSGEENENVKSYNVTVGQTEDERKTGDQKSFQLRWADKNQIFLWLHIHSAPNFWLHPPHVGHQCSLCYPRKKQKHITRFNHWPFSPGDPICDSLRKLIFLPCRGIDNIPICIGKHFKEAGWSTKYPSDLP